MKKLLSIIISIALVLTMGTGSAFAETPDNIKSVFEKTGDYIYETVAEPACSGVGGEWVMYGLAKGGYPMSDEYINAYKANVEKTVSEAKGILHRRKLTEYSRVIVAYNQLGLDVTDVAGYNLADELADYDSVIWQGLNGPIWALIALDGCDYPFSEAVRASSTNITTADKLIDCILDAQHDDGGWSLTEDKTTASDPDMTGMAVYALAPHRTENNAVKKALEKAVICMSELQEESGGYATWGAETSESASQIICALCSLGINPNMDSRFKKNGNSVIDALFTYYDSEVGGFRHVNEAYGGYEPVVNQMATEQAYYALVAYKISIPDKVTGLKVSCTKTKTVTVKYGEDETAAGYQIKIATDSKFKKNVSTLTSKTSSRTVKNLKKGTTYYVKVRAYKVVNGVKSYGAYSVVKTVKCK